MVAGLNLIDLTFVRGMKSNAVLIEFRLVGHRNFSDLTRMFIRDFFDLQA